MDEPKFDYISGWQLSLAYNLDWKEIPFAMYNCKCFLNARDIKLVGDLRELDRNYPRNSSDKVNIIDCFYDFRIFISGFFNRNYASFCSSDFSNEMDQKFKSKYGITFGYGVSIFEKILRHAIYSSQIARKEAILLFHDYKIPLINNNFISRSEFYDIINECNDESNRLKSLWNEILVNSELTESDKKCIRCIIGKCEHRCHTEIYDELFPFKKSISPDNKRRYINNLKKKADELSKRFQLPLPSWKSS